MAVYSYDHQFIFILLWSNVYYIGDSLVHLHLKVLGHRTLPFTPLLQLSYKNNK